MAIVASSSFISGVSIPKIQSDHATASFFDRP
jgi:hypothetical protein